MYLSGHPVEPKWAVELVNRFVPKTYMRINYKITFYLPLTGKKRSYIYGHCSTRNRHIELCASDTEQTTESLWVVLHEIVHAIHDVNHPIAGGYYANIKRNAGCRRRPRNSIHPPAFWDIAIELYKQFPGIMDFALTREYDVGRKYIKAKLGI